MNRNQRKPFKSFLPVELETELCHLEHFDPAEDIRSKKQIQNLKTKFIDIFDISDFIAVKNTEIPFGFLRSFAGS